MMCGGPMQPPHQLDLSLPLPRRVHSLTVCHQRCGTSRFHAHGCSAARWSGPLSINVKVSTAQAMFYCDLRCPHLCLDHSHLAFDPQAKVLSGASALLAYLDVHSCQLSVASVGACHATLGAAVGSFQRSTAMPVTVCGGHSNRWGFAMKEGLPAFCNAYSHQLQGEDGGESTESRCVGPASSYHFAHTYFADQTCMHVVL